MTNEVASGAVRLDVDGSALDVLRPLFVAVEGSCEAWTDAEVVQRVLIRGAMEYAKSAGKSWDDVTAVAAQLRTALSP